MNGYEKLNYRESNLLWDRERERPEEELDQIEIAYFERTEAGHFRFPSFRRIL